MADKKRTVTVKTTDGFIFCVAPNNPSEGSTNMRDVVNTLPRENSQASILIVIT